MPTVTGLRPAGSDDDRLRVEVDGRREGELPAARAERMDLREGRSLTGEELDRLRSEVHRQEAMDRALNYLSYRPRSEAELERKLRAGDFSEDAARHAVERCRELGYVDDLEFARSHVRDRVRLKPRGVRRLRDELRKKGVDEETAGKAIRRAFREAGVTERDLLERAAEKKWAELEGEDPVGERRRFRSYLSRRGFPFAHIRDVEREYFGDRLYRDEYPDDAEPGADDVAESGTDDVAEPGPDASAD